MRRQGVTGSIVEDAALAWLRDLGCTVLYGRDISPDDGATSPPLFQPERGSYRDIVLEGWLRDALARLNPRLPPEALEDAVRGDILAQLSESERAGWNWLVTRDTVTTAEYQEAMKLPNRTAKNHMKKLTDLGLLRMVGAGRATRYGVVRA